MNRTQTHHTRNTHTFSLIALALMLLAPLAGCQTNETHEQWEQQANNRYLNLRSGMMLEMARQQFETGDLDQAQKSVKDAMQIDPENAELHVLAGRISLERNRLERSYHLLSAAQELDADNADAYYYQGIILQRWQRYEKAQQKYQQAYDIQPDEPSYLLAVSEMMAERGQTEQAVATLEDKLNYFDQNATIRAQLGYLYKLRNRPDKAAPMFKQAALMNPDNTKLPEELALAQFAAGQNEASIATLETLLRDADKADRRDLRRTLARAYLELEQVDKARATYLELARSEHGEPSDWLRLGQLAWQAEDYGAALQAANRVTELSPQRHEGYLLAGMVWHKRGHLDNALSMFDRAAKRAEQRSEPLIMRGLSLQQAGRKVAARQAYRQALDRNPSDRRARRLLDSLESATP